PQASSAPPAAGASATLTHYGGEQVQISAAATAPSLVVLTDSYYPGWTATVDGHPASLQRVDYVLRGVRIGPGRHTIVMRYQPTAGTMGGVISVLTRLVILGAGAGGIWPRRRAVAA